MSKGRPLNHVGVSCDSNDYPNGNDDHLGRIFKRASPFPPAHRCFDILQLCYTYPRQGESHIMSLQGNLKRLQVRYTKV